MKFLAAYRSRRWSAFVIALIAATFFAASPVVSLAHELADHLNPASQLDDGHNGSHAPVCKFCVGLAGTASAAVGDVLSLAFVPPSYSAPSTTPVQYFQPVVALPYLSRAPPRA
jgi:hypothetical protein